MALIEEYVFAMIIYRKRRRTLVFRDKYSVLQYDYFVDYPSDDPYIAIDGVATKITFFTADLHSL